MGSRDPEELARIVVDQGYRLHRELGPGLMESVYESVLAGRLADAGLFVECQKAIDIHVDGRLYPSAFRADIIVNNALLIELKSVENLAPVHIKQALIIHPAFEYAVGIANQFRCCHLQGRHQTHHERHREMITKALFPSSLCGFYAHQTVTP